MAPVLGALFAILIGILAIRPYLDYQQQSFENIKAANTASQFRQLINAVELYVQSNCLSTANGIAISPSCSNMSLSSVLQQLQSAGYLPPGISTTNPYGQNWYISVSLQNGAVQALLYSAGGQNIPPKLAPEIAAETGQEGGFVPQNGEYNNVATNTAEGAYGHWNVAIPQGISPSPGPGDLVALLDVGQNGVNDDQNADYLYRRQVPGDKNGNLNTMQTDLNMAGNDVTNATEVEAQNGSSMAMMSANSSNSGLSIEAPQSGGSTSVSMEGGQSSSLEMTGGQSSSLEMTGGQSSSLEMTGGQSSTLEMDGSQSSSFSMDGSTVADFTVSGGEATASIDGTTASLLLSGSEPSPGGTTSGSTSPTSSLTVEGDNPALSVIGSGASVTVGTQGATSGLVISSSDESVGSSTNCSQAQLGTIAPNANGSGMPLVCTVPPQSGRLGFVTGAYGTINIILNPVSQTSQATWQLLGGQFTALQYMALQPASLNGSAPTPLGIYVNNTNMPLFISSNCPLNDGTGGEGGTNPGDTGTSLNLYLSNSAENVITSLANPNFSNAEWTLSGVSLNGGGVGSPSSSVIVPPGYAFAYDLYTDKSYNGNNTSFCDFVFAY